jgi:short-subunit dehydrogenase
VLRRIEDSAVVITGASSGIGRAAALEFAKRGASVVLNARRVEPLEEVAEECRRHGVQAFAVAGDMSDPETAQRLARQALESFGRIDTWVNNAAVTMWARFHEAPLEDFERVIRINLFGYIYGARAAIVQFREQGSGVLINNASMMARLSEPYVGSYVISKMGIRGAGMSIRQELELDGLLRRIRVCTVMPATIDTPFFQHSANYTGRAAKAMPPVYSAERVARTIVNLARFPRREVFVGNSARMLNQQSKLFPSLTERQIALATDKLHLYRDRPAPPSSGNLFEPMAAGDTIDGGWHGRRNELVRRAATAAVLGGGVALRMRDSDGSRSTLRRVAFRAAAGLALRERRNGGVAGRVRAFLAGR